MYFLKKYASPDLDKRILRVVVNIFTNSIDMSETEVNEDLLGRTYEYCIATQQIKYRDYKSWKTNKCSF